MQDILITPQPLLTSGEPSIVFTASGDVSPITLNVISGVSPISGVSQAGSGITSLSFEGTQGQLFSIIDNLSSGTLFSVSDIAGLPFMEIDASGDIKLAQFGNTVTTYKPIQFSNTGIPTHQEGMLFYDDDNKALAYYNEEADVTLQIGQEQFLRSRNTTGATITNGSIVIITGAHGNVAPTISGAIATSESASQVIGVATHNIEDNSFGYVTTYGIVRDVDTSAFSDGDEIFLSSTSVGSGTPIVPPLPNYKVSIGHVIRSHATAGSMLVQVKSPKLAGGDTKSEYPVYVSGIPFVTASGNGGDSAVLGYDSDFNWDSGNSRLGIGTATPEAKLDITSNTTSDQAPRTILSITGKTGSGTNWSGTDVEAGYTHTDGSADPLVTNITPINNKIYVIVYTISGLSAGRFDFIDFGGVRKNVYNGSNGTYTISLKAENSTDPLELTPRSDFAGTVSIDSITSVEPREAIVSIRTSDGTIANEIRAGVSESQPSNSIYIGYEAGQSASGVGSPSNTAVGRLALRSNVLGGYNTVFGYLSATECTQNSYLTLVGHRVLPYFRSNSTNVYNTAIGTNIAWGSSFTGLSNILIGNNIFSNTATTASNNIAIGLSSMYVATTASNNISVGNSSLRNHTTGNQNVALGDSAGRNDGSNTSLTVTNNSVFIGYNTKASGDSQTNQIVIGHQAVGNGSNSVTLGNTSITKTILNGDVGIDTISPGAKLHAVATSATDVGVIVEGAAAQTANLTEWRTSAGDVLTSIDNDGNVDISGILRCNDIGVTTGTLSINAGNGSPVYFKFNNTVEYVLNAASFRPNNLAKDLGTDTYRWTNLYTKNIYASGTITNPKGEYNAESFGLLAEAAASGVAFGYDAEATGTRSTAIGYLTRATTDSVSVGMRSTSKFRSTSIGPQAGVSILGGQYTDLMGYSAGNGSPLLSSSVGVGGFSLNSASGTGLTAFGFRSLTRASGNYNIAIGYEAGQDVVGTGNITICHRDSKNTIGTNDAKLNINDMIKGDFNAGTLGINTDYNPGATLHAIAANTTDVVGLFEGVAGQSANVLEVKDSDGNTDFSVTAGGTTNARGLVLTNAITLNTGYYIQWGGGNNRIRGFSGGVGGGRIELIAGANDGEGGEEIPLVARGDGRGGKGAVIMGQNRDTDYHLEVVGSGSFDGVNISGALTFPIQEDIGAGDQDFMIKYDPSFQAAGGTGAVARISTNMSASGAVTPIHIIAGTSGNVNYNGLKVFENNINIYSDIYPQSSFSSNNPSFGTSTNPFYKGHVSEFIVGNYFSQATLVGDGQNKLGLRNGTNAQTFNLYNTYTSASNYARLQILGDGTDYVIKAANAGASSQGNTILRAGAATTIPSVIQGAASQSASLTEWQNSSSDVLTQVDATGSISTAAPTYIYTSGALGDADYNRIKIYNMSIS